MYKIRLLTVLLCSLIFLSTLSWPAEPQTLEEALLYEKRNMFKEYCTVLNRAINEKGLGPISPFFIKFSRDDEATKKNKDALFFDCFNITKDEFLDMQNTDEAEFIKAYVNLFPKSKLGFFDMLAGMFLQYKKSEKIFTHLYFNTTDEQIKYNAGFCPGAIYYSSGKEEEGLKLMKQSVDRGYVMSFAIDGISMLPPKY